MTTSHKKYQIKVLPGPLPPFETDSWQEAAAHFEQALAMPGAHVVLRIRNIEVAEGRRCPLCGEVYVGHQATSRVDNKTEICPTCEMRQALETADDLIDAEQRLAILQLVTHGHPAIEPWQPWVPWLAMSGQLDRVPSDRYGVYEVRLAGKDEEEAPLVHIGKAFTGRNGLHGRIKDMLAAGGAHVEGRRILHGGRSRGGHVYEPLPPSTLEVRWAVCDNPTAVERALQQAHYDRWGRLPTHDEYRG